VLREEYKKSMEITTNIVSMFWVLSNYTDFHNIVSQNQVGDATIKIIEFQTKRYKDRKAEIEKKE